MKQKISTVTDALSEAQYEYEIIVVDDGSTDGTVEKVRDWTRRESAHSLPLSRGRTGFSGGGVVRLHC
jgi:glycosyltransferase involved in cell wall biosynthesis